MANKIREKRALVIGVSQYEHTEPLEFCKNDAKEMYTTLRSLGYKIPISLVGYAEFNVMSDAIIDFFSDQTVGPDETLLFYYSGHGIPDIDGDMYLSTSEIDPKLPDKRGFSFSRLTKLIQRSISLRIVAILDCCYSGAARVSKGGGKDDAALLGSAAIRNSSRILEGEGKCILAASQGLQEAYALEEHSHSIYTYYLLQGLNGNEFSVDDNGLVTPDTLSRYVYNAMMSLPPSERPRQTPFKRVESSGDIVLAHYPQYAKRSTQNQLPISDVESQAEITRLWEQLDELRASQDKNANFEYISKVLLQRDKEIERLRQKMLETAHASELLQQIDELQAEAAKMKIELDRFQMEHKNMASTIDEMITRYVKQRKGSFDIARCAEDLKLSKSKVREIISRLGRV